MVSISTDKCITPLPKTIHLSALSVLLMRIARFFSSSFSRRSDIWREVTNRPSLPKKGESFIENNMLIVGSSISILFNGSGFSTLQIESPISKPSIPVKAHISPPLTESTFTFFIPSNTNTSLILCFFWVPSLLDKIIGMFGFIAPLVSLPIAILPTKDEKSKEVISIWVFPSSIFIGG